MTWMSQDRKTVARDDAPSGNSGRPGDVRRSPAFWSLCGQLGLLAVALVFSVASGSKGDRAETGACPEGEVCSPDTPSGLYFQGPGFADVLLNSDVQTTAVGGRQTLNIEPAGFGEHLDSFDAETMEPVVTVATVNPPRVTLQGDAVGSTYLRIFEPLTGALYDRLTVSSAEVETVEVEPLVYESPFEDDGLYPPLYWGDTSLTWIARMYSTNTRLVDENLTFDTSTADVEVTQPGTWDLAEVTPTAGVDVIMVTAESGSGVTGEASVDLAHEVDYILEDPDSPVPQTHDASDQLHLCFAAYLGDRRILGIPWEFTMTGPEGEEPEHLGPVLFESNCVTVRAGTAGLWHLDVTAGTVTESHEISMLPPAPPPPPTPPSPSPTPPPTELFTPMTPTIPGTPGHRAIRKE